MTTTEITVQSLIEQALQVRTRAYAPYSNYAVGAALASSGGETFVGCNVENAAYPAGICAERSALVRAVSDGVQQFDTLVVATQNGGSPCGICRQMLYEFAPGLRVVTVNPSGEIVLDMPLHELLIHGFGPHNLPQE